MRDVERDRAGISERTLTCAGKERQEGRACRGENWPERPSLNFRVSMVVAGTSTGNDLCPGRSKGSLLTLGGAEPMGSQCFPPSFLAPDINEGAAKPPNWTTLWVERFIGD